MTNVASESSSAASFTILAHDKECLDALVWRATGRGVDLVEQVLRDNPGLAATGSALPEGTAVRINLDLAETVTSPLQLQQLWD